MYSLVIPVYKNEASLPEVLEVVARLNDELGGELEPVFVVDGSPDGSLEFLKKSLPAQPFRSRLLALSRNFGSFAAVRSGLAEATGPYFAVMTADLQEPPQLIRDFFSALESGEADVVLGARSARADPLLSRIFSSTFWWLYRRLVHRAIPPGGLDVFGCNQPFRDEILRLQESNTSLVGLVCWLGFRRQSVSFERQERRHGRSAWTLARKLDYLVDSVFAFTDLPIRLLALVGGAGLTISVIFSSIVLGAHMMSKIEVPGYVPTILAITFFGSLNLVCFSILGAYLWRTFENTKKRPGFIVMEKTIFGKAGE